MNCSNDIEWYRCIWMEIDRDIREIIVLMGGLIVVIRNKLAAVVKDGPAVIIRNGACYRCQGRAHYCHQGWTYCRHRGWPCCCRMWWTLICLGRRRCFHNGADACHGRSCFHWIGINGRGSVSYIKMWWLKYGRWSRVCDMIMMLVPMSKFDALEAAIRGHWWILWSSLRQV